MKPEDEALTLIKPTESECEEIISIANRLKNDTKEYFQRKGHDVTVEYAGSVAKGTFLRNPDIDLFIMFPDSISKKEMESLGLEAGKDLINGVTMYAEHPYTTGMFHGLSVDMVPCFSIADTRHMKTAVDRTPFHTKYILSHTDPWMRDQMRIVKQFMKGIGAYGAEPSVRGFSGYLCELLALHYGGFEGFINASSKWREGETIVHEKKGKKMSSALVFYDPVDEERNVASAVHLDTMGKVIIASKEYIKNPSLKFFFPNERKPLTIETLTNEVQRRKTEIISLIFPNPHIIEENLQAQIWKTVYGVLEKLESLGFEPLNESHSYDSDKVTISIECANGILPKTYLHAGPPLWTDNCSIFLEKWKNNPCGKPFQKSGRWFVLAERKNRTLKEAILDNLNGTSIGKDFDLKKLEVLETNETLKKVDTKLLTELLFPLEKWEI